MMSFSATRILLEGLTACYPSNNGVDATEAFSACWVGDGLRAIRLQAIADRTNQSFEILWRSGLIGLVFTAVLATGENGKR